MKKRSRFLGIAGGLLFIAFVAVNLTVSRNYQGDETTTQLTLVELEAKAQTDFELCTRDEGSIPVIICAGPFEDYGCCLYCNIAQGCVWTGSNQNYCPAACN